MTVELSSDYAAYLARVGDFRIRVSRHLGRWHLEVCDPEWRDVGDTLACFDDIDTAAEKQRVKSWAAEVLDVWEVELHRGSRARGEFTVTVEE